ncbi:MAG: phosphate ABC transporter permease PstA [Candidatus Omnitrophota bacterium]
MKAKKLTEIIGFNILKLCAGIVIFVLVVILYDLITKGAGVISWKFLTTMPKNGMTEGGILPAIVGTFLVTVITAILAIPMGMGCAIYLNEYARGGKITRIVRMAIRNLSGVPSIVYGLFGVILFVQMMNLGTCILSAGLTLGLMTLPWTITASEEALKNVPNSYREGALALGATKWQSIRTNVLPYAVPGMLTGTILGLSRAAGETAPILFTGAAFYLPFLPKSLSDQFMALPYHLYIMSTQHHAISKVRPIAYGTALVLIVLVFGINLFAVVLRYHLRKIRTE